MANSAKNVEKKEAGNGASVERTRSTVLYRPNVDILERKEEIVLMADMPGVDESKVDITLEKNVLTIYGKVDANLPDGLRVIHAEYGIGDYQRSFTLSGEIDRERIKATMKNGVLKLVLPKAEALKTKKIAVETGA